MADDDDEEMTLEPDEEFEEDEGDVEDLDPEELDEEELDEEELDDEFGDDEMIGESDEDDEEGDTGGPVRRSVSSDDDDDDDDMLAADDVEPAFAWFPALRPLLGRRAPKGEEGQLVGREGPAGRGGGSWVCSPDVPPRRPQPRAEDPSRTLSP